MRVAGLHPDDARFVAQTAVEYAQALSPRATGDSARSFSPIWGHGFFGIAWAHQHVWFQEMGIRPFTMHNLAGKVVPMWINDPLGEERRRNPRAEVRTLEDGRVQVLIFRRAALKGETRVVKRRENGRTIEKVVPRSWPGAPGRINRREAPAPNTAPGRVGGRIAQGNVGVRWRHPGLFGRYFLREALIKAANFHALPLGSIMYAAEGVRAKRQASAAVRRRQLRSAGVR